MATDFDEASRGVWRQMRAGTAYQQPDPDTGEYTADFWGAKAGEEIKFKELVSFINKQLGQSFDMLVWNDYAAHSYYSMYRPTEYAAPSQPTTTATYFEYTNETGEKIRTHLKGKINKRIDNLEDNFGFNISIDAQRKTILAVLKLYYWNTYQYRNDAPDTENPDDFRIDPKYVAIEVTTNVLTDFYNLVKAVRSPDSKYVQKAIAAKLSHEIHNIKTSNQANFLYSNSPNFVFALLKDLIELELAFKHMLLLKDYDDTGWFSNFKDSSGAILTLLKIVGDTSVLYFKFIEQPLLIKQLYINMDGSSMHNGTEELNKVIFSGLLCSLCQGMNFNEQLKDSEGNILTLPEFYIGGDYRLESNVDPDNDTFGDKIFLRQIKDNYTKYKKPLSNPYGIYTPPNIDDTYNNPTYEKEGNYYPLQPIKLINESDSQNDSSSKSVTVPAIFIKALSDKAEWEEIYRNIRIGGDVLAAVLGVASLRALSGFKSLIGILDISMATADLNIQVAIDDIKQLEGGQEFLDTWDDIMLVGSAIMAPVLVETLIDLGARLFSRSTLDASKEFIRLRLAKVIMEINIANFTGNSIKVLATGTEICAEVKGIKLFQATRLQKAGVVFVKGETSVEKGLRTNFAVFHEGELIAKGSAGEVRGILKNVLGLKGNQLKEALAGIPRLNVRGVWQFVNKSGNRIEWVNQLLRSNDLENSISAALKSREKSRLWEAEVAIEIQKYDKITDFSNDVKNITLKNIAGDIDVASENYFIECKESLRKNSLNNKFGKQFEKYLDPGNSSFINPKNKKVILAIKNLDDTRTLSHPILKELQKKGVKIVIGKHNFKKLKP